VSAAQAQVAAAEAAIAAAETEAVGARAAVAAVAATIVRITSDIDDSQLKAPRDGRVQFKVTQPGEVLGAGGKVLNLVDLTDVYMTFFLPEAIAGRLGIGADTRLVLDAAPQWVIPAKVTFVADVAQYTPKTVETETERQKLMFRVRAHIPPDLLRAHMQLVKTGLPGVAYVRWQNDATWPAGLQPTFK
jgi:HlyD family secretion protein